MERSEIAIIIPAYNEASTIENILKEVIKYGTVILINDGSTDNTLELAKRHDIIIINNEKNFGYDKSLNIGFNYSKDKFKYLITFDADGQHSSEDLSIIISKLKENFDLIYGTRNRINRMSEKIFLFLSKKIFGINDPLTGLKALNLEKFKLKTEFSKFKSLGSEIVFFAKMNNYRTTDISINISSREDISRIGGPLKSNLLVLKAMVIVFISYLFKKL